MKIPAFNPRLMPSRLLSQLEQHPSLPLLTIDHFRRALIKPLPEKTGLLSRDVSHVKTKRAAAVLILLIEQNNDFDVVLTKRAAHLRHHAGQISFVGGGMEGDETPIQTALREAHEEIGLDGTTLTVMGQLAVYQTITGFLVTPIVATMSQVDWQKQQLRVDANEVDHVFTVPLSKLLNHDEIHVHGYAWASKKLRYYSVTHGDYFIWGASMAMLRHLDVALRAL